MKYEIKRSNRKTIAIKVSNGIVSVYAPYHVKEHVLHDFVQKKRAWIERKLQAYRPVGVNIFEMKVCDIFGVRRQIEVNYDTRSFDIQLLSDTLQITLPEKYNEKRINEQVEAFLKDILDVNISRFVKDVAGILSIDVPPYIVRKYKRLYGRCASNGSLGFNTYLFHESWDFIYYVVVHECAHLIEFNHSKQFYAIVTSIMPDYKDVIAKQRRSQFQDQDL